MSNVEIGSKRSNDYDEYGEISFNKRPKNDQQKLRFLLIGRFCGKIIGKRGENIKRIRRDLGVHVNLPDTRSSERILTIHGDRESCVNVLKEIVSSCKEAPYPVDPKGKCTYEVNFLAHSDQVGAIIGKGGQKIKEIREESGGKIKVYQDCLANSTERVVAIGGDDASRLIAAFDIVLDILQDHPTRKQAIYYDPMNKNNDGQSGGASQMAVGGGNQMAVGGNQLGALGNGLGGFGALGSLTELAAGAATLLGQLGVGAQAGGGILGAGGGGFSNMSANNLNNQNSFLGNVDNRSGQNAVFGNDQTVGFGMNHTTPVTSGGFAQFNNGSSNVSRDNRNGFSFDERDNRDSRDFTQMKTITKVTVSNDMCGAIIGKSGQRIKDIRHSTGAKVDFSETEKGSKEDRVITITGTQQQTIAAQQMMTECVRNRNM